MDPQKSAAGAAGEKRAEGSPRRLGRGLSALIGPAPVKVDIPNNIQTSGGGQLVGGVGGSGGAAPDRGAGERGGAALESAAAGVVAAAGPDGGGAVGERVLMVGVGEVVASRFQPRQVFDEEKLKELAESIRSIGVMQPVIVRKRGAEGQRGEGAEGVGYELVAGERRWRAAQLAGLTRIPAIVRELDDESCAAWGLIENMQREDLDPMERAAACRVMMERFGVSAPELASRLGVDRSTVVNLVRLTELEPSIQGMVRRGDLTMGHARALLGVASENGARLALATLVGLEGWSVRKLEMEVKKVGKGLPPARGAVGGVGRSAAVADLEKRLGEHLGTRVKIKTDRSGKRGRVELAFYDLDHFEGLMQRMGYGQGR